MAGGSGAARAVPAAALPEGGVALKLFDGGVAWNFVKNTGEGSFTLTKDPEGRGVGVMAYDFSKAKAQSTPYVLASAPIDVPGGKEIAIQVRTAIPQRLTFRVTDATGQALQYKTKTNGGGAWETARFPLGRFHCRVVVGVRVDVVDDLPAVRRVDEFDPGDEDPLLREQPLLRPLSHIRELAARNYRSFPVNNYVCLYKFERETIYIAHVFHQSQDYARLV